MFSCKSDATWYIAAQNNDIKQLQKLFKGSTGGRDSRQTNQLQNIYQGFTALFYSVVFNSYEAFQFLFQFEVQHSLEFPVEVKIGTRLVQIQAGTNVLSMALLYNRLQMTNFALQQVVSYPSLLNADSQFLTPAHIAATHYNNAATALLNQNMIYEKLAAKYSADGLTFIGCGALFKRPLIFRKVIEILKDQRLKQEIKKTLSQSVSKEISDLQKLVSEEVDFSKIGSNAQQQDLCVVLIQEIKNLVASQ